MKLDWSDLKGELSLWRRENLTLPLWWRDDDAIAETPELQRLSDIATDDDLPVHVAVIPDLIETSLAPVITAQQSLIPVVHGWRHENNASDGLKKSEFGHPRGNATAELAQAYKRMSQEFGPALVPLFVPPWNRLSDELLPALVSSGYAGVSTYSPRKSAYPVEGIIQINTHIDPIFWRGHRGLVAPETLIAGLTTTLEARRKGEADLDEPLGLLTHHLVHTDEVWDFTHDLVKLLLDEGGRPADIRALLRTKR